MSISRQVYLTWQLDGTAPATTGNYSTPFFTADQAYQLISCTGRHGTAGSDGGAVTVMLTKAASGTAMSAGTNMLSAGMSLKTTADTNYAGSLNATATNTTLASGDSISWVLTGTPTAVANLCLTCVFQVV